MTAPGEVDARAQRPGLRHRVVQRTRGRALGLLGGVLLIAVVVVADVIEGPRPAYIGVLVAAPLLTAALSRPCDALTIGALALLAGQGYAASIGAGTTHGQLVRLGFLTVATVVAVLAAGLREARERQLREVTDIAEAAQTAILRPVPPRAGSLALAGSYRSAARAAQVGGDFYDVADTPHGVRIVLGDVRGKGLDAVRLAVTVLGAFREAAFTAGPELGAVARSVGDSTRRAVEPEDFVTAVFVELDLDGRGSLVRCGHPAPLLIRPAGVAPVPSRLDQPPLGLVTVPVAEPFVLARGERLLLFTDGLSEARDPHGTFLDVEGAAVDLAHGTLDEALDRLLTTVDAHTRGRLGDDLAVLLLERVGGGPGEVTDAPGCGPGGAARDLPRTRIVAPRVPRPSAG